MTLLQLKTRRLFVILVILSILFVLLEVNMQVVVNASPGWLPDWNYRKSHVIQSAAGAGTDYQVKITTHYGGISPGATRFMNLQKYAGNPLDVPENGASGDVHPDVLYFPAGIDGYEYWITYTPYPPGTTEHPSISRGHDGITWTDAGITNPVVTSGSPSTIEDADPDMKYIPDLNEWFMVWTIYRMSDGYSWVGFAYSLDGVSWIKYDGNPVNGNANPIILDSADSNGQPAWEASGGISRVTEPSLLYENGVFYLFYATYVGGNNRGKCGYATFTWDKTNHNIQNLQRYTGNPIVDLPADGIFASGCGHIDISKSGSTYYLYLDRQLTSSSNFELALLTSTDKISWTNQGRVLQRGSPGWDDTHIYRSAPVTDGVGNIIDFSGTLQLYYSAFSSTVSSGIGLATGTDAPPTPPPPDSGEDAYLNQSCRTDFGDVRFTGNDGTTLLDYWMAKKVDGDYATFWVKVAGDLNATDQTIYVYYGKSDATSLSDIKATSLWNHGDDFNDNARDPALWDAFKLQSTHVGAATETNQRLELYVGQSATCVGFVSHDAINAQNFEMSILAHNPSISEVGFYLHTTKVTDGMSTSNQDCIDVADHCYRIMLYPAGGQCYVQKRVNGLISELYSGTALSKENTLKIRVEDSVVQFFEGDTQRVSDSWSLPTRNCHVIVEGWGGSTGTDWADNFWIRKYVSPEPSHGIWGIEEQLGTKLYVDPTLTEENHSNVGTSFQVNMTVTDITDLQGFDLNLTWDNTLLALSSVDFTSTLNSVWGSGNWYALKNESGVGYYKLVAVSTASSFTGAGPTPLCTLSLTVQDPQSNSERQTLIHFGTHKLSDSQSNPIPHIITDGTYKIAGVEPTLRMVPSLIEKNSFDVGTTFKTNITIQSIDGLFGFDLNITWNSMLLTFNNSYYQDTLDAIWGSGKWFLVKNETGAASYRLVALSTADSFNTTQTQTLFVLELRVEDFSQPGETSIHFAIHKLSNLQADPITHTAEDGIYRFMKTPTLEMEPVDRTCRKINECFNVAINVSDAYNVTGFKFEIYYNTTLLDYVDASWNAWGSGTMNVYEALGIINGSTSGVPITGTQYLLTVQFKSTCYHVWKIAPGWTNNLTDSIFFQWANLSYPSGPDLHYQRGSVGQIFIGPDVTYTFSPIQGDVDNDGTVNVLDLRTVAIYYMVKQGDPNWTQASNYDLNGDGIVDVFDLRTVAYNFGYTYTP